MTAWGYRLLVLAHMAGVMVWLGAVAYQVLILLPGMSAAGFEREVRYRLLRAVKHRLRRIVGAAVVMTVASGLAMAHLRGFLRFDASADDARQHVFHLKLVAAGLLVLTFLFALPLLARVKTGVVRGRLFKLIHVMVLIVGLLAALAGVALSR